MTVEERSEAIKNAGNDRLKAGKFGEAIKLYSEAITLHETAVLYSNRSFAHFKQVKFPRFCFDWHNVVSTTCMVVHVCSPLIS